MCKGPEVGPLSPQDAQTDKLGPVGMMLRREMSGDMEQRAKPQGSRHLSVRARPYVERSTPGHKPTPAPAVPPGSRS